MAQQVSTNTFGCAKWIVSSDATQGTHTTIAGALTSASSGDTIFIRTGTYTENLTLKAGVNLATYACDALTPNVTIIGNCTATFAGTCSISGIRLQTNSAALLTVSGSNATIVNLNNCYLNCSNNTGITFSTSSSSAQININYCQGNLGTTGIGFFAQSSAGTLNIFHCKFTNTGSSTTANTVSAGMLNMKYTDIDNLFSTSSTGGFLIQNSRIDSSSNNTTVTHNGSTTSGIQQTILISGTATAISVGSGSVLNVGSVGVNSSNATSVTGSGTVGYGILYPAANSDIGAVSASTSTSYRNQISSIRFKNGASDLDYYAEGTWTPTLIGESTAGTTTYSSQNGYYTRVGNKVTCWGTVIATGATGTGNASFGGYPFTVKNQTNGAAQGAAIYASAGSAWPAGTSSICLTGIINTIAGRFYASGTSSVGAAMQLANTAITAQGTINFQV